MADSVEFEYLNDPPSERARMILDIINNFIQHTPDLSAQDTLDQMLGHREGTAGQVVLAQSEERYLTWECWNDKLRFDGPLAFMHKLGFDFMDDHMVVDWGRALQAAPVLPPRYALRLRELEKFMGVPINDGHGIADLWANDVPEAAEFTARCLRCFELRALRQWLLASDEPRVCDGLVARVYIELCDEQAEPLEPGQPEDDRILALAAQNEQA